MSKKLSCFCWHENAIDKEKKESLSLPVKWSNSETVFPSEFLGQNKRLLAETATPLSTHSPEERGGLGVSIPLTCPTHPRGHGVGSLGYNLSSCQWGFEFSCYPGGDVSASELRPSAQPMELSSDSWSPKRCSI